MSYLSEPSRRWSVVILLWGLVWLVAAAIVVVAATSLTIATSYPVTLARLIATIILAGAAPLAVVLAALHLVRRPDGDANLQLAEFEVRTAAAGAATAAVRAGLLDVDATLVVITGRLERWHDTAATDGSGLTGAAARLEGAAATLSTASQAAMAGAHDLARLLPEAQRQAEAVAATLATTGSETRRQLKDIETMLAGVWAQNVEAREQVEAVSATTAGMIGGIERATIAAGEAIAARTATLDGAVDAALDRTTGALDATRDAVHVQTSALLASVDQARVALDAIGGEAARAITTRVEQATTAAVALGGQLDDHDARSVKTMAAIERSFAVLDKRLGHAATMGMATLDGFHARMTAIRAVADGIDLPLAATNLALRDAEATTARLAEHGRTTLAILGEHLPAQRDAIAGLTVDVAGLTDLTTGLAAPVAGAASAIADAAAAFERQRVSVEIAAAALAAELARAQVTLTAIEGTAHGSALAAATALIEVLSRVREVANATAGTMRTTLGGIVAEAEAALEQAGTTRAAAAFGDPIRAEIAGLEGASAMAGAAAQSVADRIAARLLGLAAAVATVEARMEETEARNDSRLRTDLTARSAILLALLNDQAIDIARPLATEVTDGDWLAYLRGDRSRFGRRAVRLADGNTARAIARHYRADPVFAEAASRYLVSFDILLDRVRADREGAALAVVLVSSEAGKLYAVLAQAIRD